MTSILMTGAKKEALKYIFYIYYPVQFKKESNKIQALINSKSEFNIMASAYAKKLGFQM